MSKTKVSTIAVVLLLASVLLTLYTPAYAVYEKGVNIPPGTILDEVDPALPDYVDFRTSNITYNGGSIRLPAGANPYYVLQPRAYLSFRPTTIGVGQSLLVNVWITPGTDRVRYNRGYTVTFTKPDGTEDVIGPFDGYRGDTTAWFEYVPDVAGNWTVKFDSPSHYWPAGTYEGLRYPYPSTGDNTNWTRSWYFKAASTPEQPLIVQEDYVPSWPPSPLPTDYWTRPVAVEHREWWPILGSWPGTGWVGGGPTWDEMYPNTNTYWEDDYGFTPWVQGPNSAHIVWKRQMEDAGLIGAYAGIYAVSGSPPAPDCIYNGMAYDTMQVPINGVPTSCAVCYDIRTGEFRYTIPTAEGGFTPNIVSYVSPGEVSEYIGAEATGGWNVELISLSGNRLRKVDPWDGDVTVDRDLPSLSSTTYYRHSDARGEGPYVLSVQNLANESRLIKWTTRGSTSNFTARVISNTSYARSSLPTERDYNSGYGASITRGDLDIMGVYTGNYLTIYNLWTGVLLHNLTLRDPYYSGSTLVCDHGKVAYCSYYKYPDGSKSGYFLAFDMATGNKLWESPMMDYPWGEPAFGGYNIASAYGMIYWDTYDGIYAFNWTNGDIVWNYEALSPANFESPYITEDGLEQFAFRDDPQIADGKIYVANSEHTESHPRTRGWGLHCIDAFTGEQVWDIMLNADANAIADGYLITDCARDGILYVFGKGKSATTVTAPKTEIPLGQSLVIEGTVLDLSPAQPGTPCVSKDSMTLQMEYLHIQLPQTGLWGDETMTGVPVSLDIVDPNGNFFHIGDVTTDGYSGTFGYAWTPEVEGLYSVMANFAGDESYGSSFAQTYVNVGAAPEPYPEPPEYGTAEWPEYPEAPAYTSVDLAIIAAVVVAIVIGLVNLLLVLRKR